jgi:aminomethyltransferase
MSNLQRTLLFDYHKQHGETVDFAGWEMPVRYSSINQEHHAVRDNVGLFDVSHMGRIWVRGLDSTKYLDRLVTRDMTKVAESQAAYTFMLNEKAGFRDDVIITKFDEKEWLVVCNAGNLNKIWDWMKEHSRDYDVQMENLSSSSVMIAVQGPNSRKLMSELTDHELPRRFRADWITLLGIKVLFSGTGYTGEDGAELMIFGDQDQVKNDGIKLWTAMVEKGAEPCGLGARDTLRLEAGYSLYGNDMDENTHLLESSLAFVPFAHIDKDTNYIGKTAIMEKKGKEEKMRIFFKLLKRGIARHGYPVVIDGERVGVVTSGTMSPTTKESIGMAFVPISHKDIGVKFQIDVKGKLIDAEVCNFPIYDPKKYGISREG